MSPSNAGGIRVFMLANPSQAISAAVDAFDASASKWLSRSRASALVERVSNGLSLILLLAVFFLSTPTAPPAHDAVLSVLASSSANTARAASLACAILCLVSTCTSLASSALRRCSSQSAEPEREGRTAVVTRHAALVAAAEALLYALLVFNATLSVSVLSLAGRMRIVWPLRYVAWCSTNTRLFAAVFLITGVSNYVALSGLIAVAITMASGLVIETSHIFSPMWWAANTLAHASNFCSMAAVFVSIHRASSSGAFAPPLLRKLLWVITTLMLLLWLAFPAILYTAQLGGGGLLPSPLTSSIIASTSITTPTHTSTSTATAGGAGGGGDGASIVVDPLVLAAIADGKTTLLCMETEMMLWAFFETATKATMLALITYVGGVFAYADACFADLLLGAPALGNGSSGGGAFDFNNDATGMAPIDMSYAQQLQHVQRHQQQEHEQRLLHATATITSTTTTTSSSSLIDPSLIAAQVLTAAAHEGAGMTYSDRHSSVSVSERGSGDQLFSLQSVDGGSPLRATEATSSAPVPSMLKSPSLPASTSAPPLPPPSFLAVCIDNILRGCAPLAARSGVRLILVNLAPALGTAIIPSPIALQYARTLSVTVSAAVHASDGGRIFVNVVLMRVSLPPPLLSSPSDDYNSSTLGGEGGSSSGRPRGAIKDILRVIVTDEGSGFTHPPAHLRASGSAPQHRQLEGARSVIASIGGFLSVDSRIDRGTSVWIDIPWEPILAAASSSSTMTPSAPRSSYSSVAPLLWRLDDPASTPLEWRRGSLACSLAPPEVYALPSDPRTYSPFEFGDVGSANDKTFARSLAFISVDMVGSTLLFSKHGDAFAVTLILRFIAYVTVVVTRHNGAVVKTIGDSVLAVFQVPSEAFNASLELQARLHEFNTDVAHLWTQGAPSSLQVNVHGATLPVMEGGCSSHPLSVSPHDVHMKIGLNAGPAIAIATIDGKLDYYGTTLNVCARVEALAGAGEIVSPSQMLRYEFVATGGGQGGGGGGVGGTISSVLAHKGVRTQLFSATLRGLVGAPVELVRLMVGGGGGGGSVTTTPTRAGEGGGEESSSTVLIQPLKGAGGASRR